MEDMVRVDVEEEYERIAALKGELTEKAIGAPIDLAMFLRVRNGDLRKALDFNEKRLENSMKASEEKDAYSPPFIKTEEELEGVKVGQATNKLTNECGDYLQGTPRE